MADSVHGELGGGLFQCSGAEFHSGELGDIRGNGVVFPVLRVLHIEPGDSQVLDIHALHIGVQVPVRRVSDKRVLEVGKVLGNDVWGMCCERRGCA